MVFSFLFYIFTHCLWTKISIYCFLIYQLLSHILQVFSLPSASACSTYVSPNPLQLHFHYYKHMIRSSSAPHLRSYILNQVHFPVCYQFIINLVPQCSSWDQTYYIMFNPCTHHKQVLWALPNYIISYHYDKYFHVWSAFLLYLTSNSPSKFLH